MLTVTFGDSTLSHENVCKWYESLTGGRENVDDERPTSRIQLRTVLVYCQMTSIYSADTVGLITHLVCKLRGSFRKIAEHKLLEYEASVYKWSSLFAKSRLTHIAATR